MSDLEPISVVYLAARYSRNEEMRQRRVDLHQRGIVVSSRWIDQHGGDVLESFVAEKLNNDPAHCARYAQIDLDDIVAADTMINFTGNGGGGKGGRHVEFGVAIDTSQQIIIGPREHVFHTLPQVLQYDTWEAFLADLDSQVPIWERVGF
jgi:hypothetical protein